MAVERSYARLGAFVLVTLLVVVATAVFFVQQMRSRPVLEVVTYTPENVSGLDVSSPVRYRGVTVGKVSNLRIEPGGRLIEIGFDIFLDRITTLGADVTRLTAADAQSTFAQLRAQIIRNPVTGESYLLLDAPTDAPPPMALSFTPDRLYVPSIPSPLAAVRDQLPAFIERAEATLATFRDIINRIPDSLNRSDRFFTNIERIFQQSDLPTLSADSRKFFEKTSAQFDGMAADLNKLIGSGGAMMAFVDEARGAMKATDLPGTTEATRRAADQTVLAAEDLRRSLPAIRDALEQLRELARFLEAQPESLVYGRKPVKGKSQ